MKSRDLWRARHATSIRASSSRWTSTASTLWSRHPDADVPRASFPSATRVFRFRPSVDVARHASGDRRGSYSLRRVDFLDGIRVYGVDNVEALIEAEGWEFCVER